MAVLGVAAAGAAIGGGVALGTGAVFASTAFFTAVSIGWSAGSILGNYLFGSSSSSVQDVVTEGPRLQELSVRGGSYGVDIPEVWGIFRVGGLMIWKTDLREERSTTVSEIEGDSGKGGKSGGGSAAIATQTSYKYYATFTVAFCEGIAGVRKIWLNSTLKYDSTGGGDPGDLAPYITVYQGTQDQLPDPTMEAIEGVGNVPGYRGICYMVISDYPVEEFGNAFPNVEAEVYRQATDACTITGITEENSLTDTVSSVYWPAFDAMRSIFTCTPIYAQTIQGDYLGNDHYEYFLRRDTYDNQGNLIDSSPDNLSVGGQTNFSWDRSPFEGGRYFWFSMNWDPNTYMGMADIENQEVFFASTGDLIVAFNTRNFERHPVYRVPNFVNQYFLIERDDSGTGYNIRYIELDYDVDQGSLEIQSIALVPLVFPTGWTPPHGTALNLRESSNQQDFYIESPWIPASPPAPPGVIDLIVFKMAFGLTQVTLDVFWPLASFRPTSGGGAFIGACYLAHGGEPSGHADYSFELKEEEGDGSQIFTGDLLRNTASSWASFHPIGLTHSLYPRNNLLDQIVSLDGAGDVLPVDVSKIITDVCLRSGLTVSEIDVSGVTNQVPGYARTGMMSGRACLSTVMNLCRIDSPEVDGKLLFQNVCEIIGDTGITVTEEDLGVHPYGSESPETVALRRISELDMPREVIINFSDPEQDYDVGTHRAIDPVAIGKTSVTLDLPAVLDADEAKEIAARFLEVSEFDRVSLTFAMGPKHLQFAPGDIFYLDARGGTYQVRLSSMQISPSNTLSCEAFAYDASSFVQNEDADRAEGPAVIPVPVDSEVILLDIPVVRSIDTALPGIYAVGYEADPLFVGTWPGANLYHKIATGWLLGTFWSEGNEATWGNVDTPLGSVEHPWHWDDTSELVVTMVKGTLSSSTDLLVQEGTENQACVGLNGRWEIIGFVNAQDLGSGQYRLTRFLRARRGSEAHVGTGSVSDTFVLLDEVGVRRSALPTTLTGIEVAWRMVPEHSRLSLHSDILFTSQDVGSTPFAPVKIEGVRDGVTGDLTISWTPRSRCAIEGLMGTAYGSCEATEEYEIEIYLEGGTTVLRSVVVQDASSFVYLLQAYRADTGDTGATVIPALDIIIYQLSAVVGRGFPGTDTV